MENLAAKQPALITTDSNGDPVVITAAELRAIRDGRYSATDEQTQGLARFVVEQIDNAK